MQTPFLVTQLVFKINVISGIGGIFEMYYFSPFPLTVRFKITC